MDNLIETVDRVLARYDKQKNGWNRDWETDNVPDDEPVDMSDVHIETCPGCDFALDECQCEIKHLSWAEYRGEVN